MTRLRTAIRSIVIWWQNRRARKAMHRAIPALRELDRQEAAYRASHRRGAARIVKAKRDAVLAALSRPVQSGGR